MNYLLLAMALAVGIVSLVHRTMVKKIYDADRRSLSTFSLPTIIRREYKARFGKDALYWSSYFFNGLFAIIVLFGLFRLFR